MSEHTDSDYYDKVLSKLAADIKACPKSWRKTFLAGIPEIDWKELKERGLV